MTRKEETPMLTRTLGALFFLVSFAAVAQDLPRTQFKVIGLNSPTVAHTVDEAPFWRETLPKASKGAITADGYLQDGGRRPALRGLRPRRHHARS